MGNAVKKINKIEELRKMTIEQLIDVVTNIFLDRDNKYNMSEIYDEAHRRDMIINEICEEALKQDSVIKGVSFPIDEMKRALILNS